MNKPVVSKDKRTGAIQWSDIKDVGVISLVSKWGERVIAHVIVLFMVPSKRWSLSGGMEYVESKCLFTKVVSIKQLEEPESTNVEKAGMV